MSIFSGRPAPRPTAAAAVLAAAALSLLPVAAHAQQWSVEARGGELRYEGGPGLESSSAGAGLRYTSPAASLLLSVGIPLSGEDPAWAAASGWKRLLHRTGPFFVGVDLGADVFGQRDRTPQTVFDSPDRGLGGLLPRQRPIPEEPLDGWSASARALPVVGVEGSSVALELRVGGAAYRSEFAGERFDRELLDSDARLSFAPSPEVLLTATGRRAMAEEADYHRLGASAALVRGRATLWASAGSWMEEGLEGVEWSGGLAVDVTDRVALRVTARRDLFDPLYLTPERTSWGLGLSVKLGGPEPPRPPVPASYENGRATIVLEADAAAKAVGTGTPPRIAGDFTDWEPVAMERVDDEWRFTRSLEPGVYNYAFVTPDGEWFVPESHPGRKPDDFGGWVAVLVVEAP